VLAERTGVHPRTVDRLCSGSQKTVPISTGITILEELPYHSVLDELHAELADWETAMFMYHYDRLEYLEKLEILGQGLLSTKRLLTPTELTALRDIRFFLREAHREPSTEDHILTAEERLEAADRWFREDLGRDPTPLSPRLHRMAQEAFREERRTALERQRALHKGLQRPVITAAAVHARTHRLRRSGRLPFKSKPLEFRPPADFYDIGHDDRHRLRYVHQ
jgi:hypothetical protein